MHQFNYNTRRRSSLQFCPRFKFLLYIVLIVLVVLAVLQYTFNILFTAYMMDHHFKINVGHMQSYGLWGHPQGLPVENNNTSSSVNRTEQCSGMTKINLCPKIPAWEPSQELPVENNNISSSVNRTEQYSTMTKLNLCPKFPANLRGPIFVMKVLFPFEELEKKFPMLKPGGRYSPTECQARDKVAIIVPYRNRAVHLSILLLNLHPFLQRQQLDYGIYVVEQAGNFLFNRAMLLNVGYVEALKQYNYDCFIFHDVDLLPENDHNMYNCPEQPRHMSVAVDAFGYILPHKKLFGGVSAMTKTQFQKVNGFSNVFWGWGGEEDDMSNRLLYHRYTITRYSSVVARYQMLNHSKQQPNPKRLLYLNTGYKRFKTDGLNSLKYKVKEITNGKLFTKILVELPSPNRYYGN